MIHGYGFIQAISHYLKGSVKKDSQPEIQQPKPKKVKQLYNMRDVIKQHYRDLVDEENPHDPHDKEYLGSYQKAVSKVLKKMTEEDLQEAQKIVDQWNEDGGPSDVQLK